MENTKLFINSDERKAAGGTGFHEIQYCTKYLPVKKLVHWRNITNWADDSLYIEATVDDEIFYRYYDKIFGQFGKLDYFGINYFTKEQAEKILFDLQDKDFPDIKTLTDWLEICVKSYNGFYFLGV